VRDRHALAAVLCGLCRWSEEVPLADIRADDLDIASEVVPLLSDLTPTVFLIDVEDLVGKCPAKLIR